MSSSPWKTRLQRTRILNHARDLARSGQYQDHASIVAHLESLEGFAEARDRLRDIQSQLDHLCIRAQAGRPRFDIPGR